MKRPPNHAATLSTQQAAAVAKQANILCDRHTLDRAYDGIDVLVILLAYCKLQHSRRRKSHQAKEDATP